MRSTRRPFFIIVVPALIAFFVFHTIPVIIGVFFSFTNFAGFGSWEFVGLRNYINLFGDDRILGAYAFTAGFAVVATLATNIISLAIALALNAKIVGRNLFRGIFFMPYVLTALIVAYVFQFIFATSIPGLLSGEGWLARSGWGWVEVLRDNLLTNQSWAWVAIVVVTVWQACAFAIILYLAGLQTIPPELYEAASLDGASPWRQFRSITFPMIGAFFTINVVLSTRGFMQVFDQILALTGGGPGTATESVSVMIFRGGFAGGEFAYQTANAVVLVLVLGVVSLLQFKVLARKEATAS